MNEIRAHREPTLKEIGIEYSTTRSESSFRQLYERMKPGLENYLFKMTKDRDIAGHLFSQTMTTVHEKVDQYNPKWHISTWIYRIAFVNFCMSLRQEKRRGMSYIADITEGPGATQYRQLEYAQASSQQRAAEEAAESPIGPLLDKLPDLVQGLPDDLRGVITAKFYEGLSLKEIASKTGRDLVEVRSNLNRAKRLIKVALSAGDPSLTKRPKKRVARALQPVDA